MIRLAAGASILLLAGGCHRAEVRLPDGCYRTESGTPLFRIGGELGTFAGGDPRQFRVKTGPDYVEIYPHFYLHDAGDGVGGSQWIAVATQPIRAGRFGVAWRGDRPVISVPIEATGEIKASPGKAC